MRYFDTHAHLNLPPLFDDAENIMNQAAAVGIMVNIVGVDGPSSERAYQLTLRHNNAVCSLGIHPNEVVALGDKLEEHLQFIERLLASDKAGLVVCVGETGLDSNRGDYLEQQLASLKRHAELAEKFNKPLNLHCRDAHKEMIAFLPQVRLPAIMHCFTAGPEEAKEYVRLGCFLSIPGVVTFKNAVALQEAVRQTPWEHLLVETDSPYLAPVPFRGKTNTPLLLPQIVACIAEIKQTPVEEAAAILFDNALRAFRLIPRP